MKVTIKHDAECQFSRQLGGCTCPMNDPASCAPIIDGHGFVPIRRDPGNCNECGLQRALHVHQRQQ